MTFFNPDTEELDPATIGRHAIRLAKAGLVGLVTMGSNGEAVHLTRAERKAVIHETRSALVKAGFSNVPVITGASEQSIRGTIELCCESAESGAEYALIVSAMKTRCTSSSQPSPTPLLFLSSCTIIRAPWQALTWTRT